MSHRSSYGSLWIAQREEIRLLRGTAQPEQSTVRFELKTHSLDELLTDL